MSLVLFPLTVMCLADIGLFLKQTLDGSGVYKQIDICNNISTC